MKESKIPHLITQIKTTTPAHALETQQLDFKRFPTISNQKDHKKKLSSLLREYAVAFANSDGGTLLLGIENNIIGPEAITGCQNYNIEEMRRMIFDGAVEVILRNGTFDEAMAKFVGKKAREGHGWRLEELIILHYLRRNDEISAKKASTILQRTQKEASETFSLMEGVFLERVGTGRGTYYQLGHEIFSSLGDKEKYTRIKGLSEEQKLQLLKNYIETNRRITNEEARVVCGINRHQATRLIQKLVHKGLLELRGKGRGAYYEKS